MNIPHSDDQAFYVRALTLLNEAHAPFLVGGAYALAHYTGIGRHTKDIDIFVRRSDYEGVIEVLASAGYQTELTHPHWLGKARSGRYFIDIIFSSGNGEAPVGEAWFENAVEGEVLGLQVRFVPVEEMIWHKAYVMERERYDGADVAHLLRTCASSLNWRRLINCFGNHWRVLFSHLILYGFIYPAERLQIPQWVMREMSNRLQIEMNEAPVDERLCRGTLFSRKQYLVDIEQWGYRDARLVPTGNLSREEIALWTAAIDKEKQKQGG
jgi:hypothetical protein